MKSKAVYATPTPTSFLLATPSWLAAAVPVLRIPFAGDLLLSTTQAITNPTSIVPPCTEYSLYNNTMLTLGRTLLSLSRATSDCPDVLQHWAHDKVRVLPDDTNKTVTNYTMPGHSLYPGKVTRYVIEECGKVKIVTIGIGLNNCGSGFTGSLLGRSNIIVGADAFKNIDLRLKSGFDANE
jgi:hypothetical protein